MYESHATGRDDKVEKEEKPAKAEEVDTLEELGSSDSEAQPPPDLELMLDRNSQPTIKS